MTTEQKFNCIFCKDVFDNKEELQVHFRKHADPKFKSKSRFGNDPQVSDEKVNEKADMVSCDVCSQMFPTISKAITHKHKVHPDHDVKYFCPWCGKLFTMKHPYNIHIQTNHDKQEQLENKIFHCDCCDVDFFLPSAMVYHNKFFHRQDTDIPEVGMSKKLRLYNQEILQLHYCAFCGEEYENKVNLYKHVTDDHGDENQCPEEVLRCPLCEAVFYHLDAYEIHLTFHTTEDLYSAQNELFADLLDFSLETVPPMIEKVENREEFDGEAHSQDTDPDNNVDAVGIEKFLELAMGQADDSNSGKVKKKKHKKSKKAAITLNEFLSMNQDVFGEDLDFQGVEEVPTRIVAKQFKSNKKATNTAAAAELEKLKQKGIVVVKVGATKPTKNAQKKAVKKATSKRELKTSSEVLTKLMNQSNNQIKIMKKSKDLEQDIKNTTVDDGNTSNHDAMDGETESKDECEEDTANKDIDETEKDTTKPDNLPTENNKTPLTTTKECSQVPDLASTLTGITVSKNTKTLHIENDKNINNDKESNGNSNIIANLGQNLKVSRVDNPIKLVENKDKIETANNSNDKQINEYHSDHEESDSETVNKGNITDPEDFNDDHNEADSPANTAQLRPAVNSLSTLKHLSHLTVKPVNQNKNTQELVKENIQTKCDEKSEAKSDKGTPHSTSTDNDIALMQSKVVIDKDPTLDTLKTLSKNLTIKSLSTPLKRSIGDNGSDDEDVINKELPKPPTNIKLKDVSGNKNITIKKIKVETNEPANKVMNAENNIVKTVQTSKILNKVNMSAIEAKTNENNQSSPMKCNTDILKNLPNISTKPSNTDILKNLPNITTKPVITKKIAQPQVVKQIDTSIKTTETRRKEEEIIEISDIDDSDNEADNSIKQPEPKESTKSVDPFKHLSKHITVKSLNPPSNLKIKVEKPEEETYDDDHHDHNQEFNSDDDIPPTVKACGQKLSSKNMAFKNVLKNLSKNITVKSRNSSPCQSNRSEDHNLHDTNDDKNDSGNDSDTETGKIKITELEDNVHSDDNFEDNFEEEHCDNNPIVESPHDSHSENEEVDDKLFDFESEINASTVLKNNQEITTNKNTVCLNNLKNISKSLTIKSLNSSSPVKQTNLTPPQEKIETVKNQPKILAIKPSTQVIKEGSNDNTNMNRKIKQMGKVVDHTSNESLNQKVSVNKEVTVKTFQSKTVIQEITTTVTKTIKTVNQTVKQETRNSSQMSIPVLPQKVLGMRPSTAKNLQGVVIRHATPAPVRPNNVVAQIRPPATVVRPSKQLVPIRPGMNMTRPRMQSAKPNLPKSSPNKQVIGKPLKFSPSAVTSGIVKRPYTEEASGPFSCFKKPKESLIPVSDVPVFGGGGDASVHVKSASHTSTSNYMSTSKMVKGNSVVTATQMKSEVTSMQQMSRLSNAVGIKVKSAQVRHSQVQEKSETSAQVEQSQAQEKSETNSMKRTTLEAIEKLQKQGLLVKKPRVEVYENSDSDHADDNVGYSSVDEHDE